MPETNITYHAYRAMPPKRWLVLGTGPTAQDDWNHARKLLPTKEQVCSALVLLNAARVPANKPTMLTELHHVTRHPDIFHLMESPQLWRVPYRHSAVYGAPYTTDCWCVPSTFLVGGSAFLAAYIAQQLGVKEVWLLGCPMSEGHYMELLQQVVTTELFPYFNKFVVSASGATKNFFGGLPVKGG